MNARQTLRPIRRPFLAALLSLAFAASAGAAPTPVRDALTLPQLSRGPGRPSLLNATVVQTDTFLSTSHGFQELNGDCNLRGWAGEDIASRVFTHVSDQFVTNRAFLGGRTLNNFLDVQRAPITGTAFGYGGQLALTDSGRVVFYDVGSEPPPSGRVLYQVYPGQNLLRRHTNEGVSGYRPRTMASDPSTGGLFIADIGASLVMYLAPGDTAFEIFSQHGPSIGSGADTTLEHAQVEAFSIALDNAGNIYYSELTTRLRMIRRNDLRVITLNNDSPIHITMNPDGSEIFYTHADGRIRRLNVAAMTVTDLTGLSDSVTVSRAHHLEWSAGNLYLATSGPSAGPWSGSIHKLVGGSLQRVAGATSFYGPVSSSASALQTPLGDIGGICPDGAGGLYLTSGPLVLRLRTDGQMEYVAGDLVSMNMGTRALRVGADMTTAPDEVANWLSPSGFGNGWSQRITSVPVDLSTHPNAVLTFDLTSELGVTTSLEVPEMDKSILNSELVAVQAQSISGGWTALTTHAFFPARGGTSSQFDHRPAGASRVEIRFGVSENDVSYLATPTRLRFVVQADPSDSNEDSPLAPGGGGGAAIIDNIALRDGATDLLPFEDFEDGTLDGGWTFSAMNGAYNERRVYLDHIIRDVPPPASLVRLETGLDYSMPSCAWTFTSAGDSVSPGVFARITSPWIARTKRDLPMLFGFAGKLNTPEQGRVLDIRVRGKNVGEDRPSAFYFPAFLLVAAQITGGDLASPFLGERLVRFPDDYFRSLNGGPFECDSIQITMIVEDRHEELLPPSGTGGYTQLPILDDIRVYEVGADSDFDGVPDFADLCPECAAGQDANGDGCIDATATFHHVETWPAGRPIRYQYSEGANLVANGAFAEFDAAFAAWQGVGGASVPVQKLLPTAVTNGSPFDGVNIVSLRDETFPFSPEVLAVTTTLELTRRTAYGDTVRLPGTVVDKDILFNPEASFSTPLQSGRFDLRSVATHEVGHLLGLDHSGVRDATMYFVQLEGQEGASLGPDDQSAIAAAYPAPDLLTAFGTIRGRVTRDTTALPVGGALVTAVLLGDSSAVVDTVASDFTDEDGTFALFRLPPGSYGVHIQSLDGSVLNGMTPDLVSARVQSVTGIPFEPEWHDSGESASDDRSLLDPLAIVAGVELTGIHVITNLDTVPPGVVAVSPPTGSTGIGIDASIQITFSDPIDTGTLNDGFGVYPVGGGTRLAGSALVADRGRRVVFTPNSALTFSTPYEIRLTTALTDQAGVPLAADFTSGFATQDQPPISITNVQPRSVSPGALVTITGTGFDPTPVAFNAAVFVDSSLDPDTVRAILVTPTTMVVQVPSNEPAGPDSVEVVVDYVGGGNRFGITILPPADLPSPNISGSPVPVGFAPTDVALAPDGSMAYVVGDGGFVTVNLAAPGGGPIRTAVPRDPRPARAIALSPDGTRAFVTYDEDSSVVAYDAAPGSAGLGTPIATIPLVGRPGVIAVAPTGWRAYAGDDASGAIHEIDIRPGSLSEYTQLRKLDFPPGAPTALTVTADNALLVVGSAAGGYYLALETLIVSFQGSGSVSGVTASPIDGRGFYALGSAGVKQADGGAIFIGGFAKDIQYAPQGQATYVVNSALNRLQVFAFSTGYRTATGVLHDVAAGANPVAVAVDAGGGLVAVANRGSRDLTLYLVTQSGVPALARVVPDVAIADELVGAQGEPGSGFSAPTHVDLGTGSTFAASNAVGRGAGFRVPALSARETQVALEQPDSLRSYGLPFAIVDPVSTFSPVAVFTIPEEDTSCAQSGGTLVGGHLPLIRLSPDGRTLGVVRENNCAVGLDLYSVATDGSLPFGGLIGRTRIGAGAGEDINGGDFAPDGRSFWSVGSLLGVRKMDTDPASTSFGLAAIFGVSEIGVGSSVLADPLGRWMMVSLTTGAAVTFWDWTVDSLVATVPITGPRSMAATGDGRYLVVGGSLRATIVDLNTLSIVTQTPLHGVPGPAADSLFFSVEVTRDGRRAMGVWGRPFDGFSPRRVAVWNLDPLAGPVGQELYFGIPAGMDGIFPNDLVSGPTAGSVLADGQFSNHLLSFDLSVIPPVLTVQPAAHGAIATTSIARSPDGRQLWMAEPGNAGTSATDGEIKLYRLGEAAAMTLVSGGAQSGFGGSQLPLPIRVRATTADGAPAQGHLVNFFVQAGQGTLGSGRSVDAIATDVNGEAEVFWTLPDAAGPVQLQADIIGSPAPTIIVDATVVLDDAQIEPQIVSLSPANGSSNLNAGTPVGVRFNQRMAPDVTEFIRLEIGGSSVPGVFRLVEDGRFVVFHPREPLPFSSSCVLAVTAGARDLDGQTVANGASSTFTIQGPPEVHVDAIIPPSGPPGAAVTLSGQGFSPLPTLNAVVFNGTLGTVETASGSGLTLQVPLAATSGPVTATTGGQTSPPVNFIVLPINPDPGGVVGDLPAGQGSRDIALSPDGGRAYITNPPLNTVNVLDLVQAQTLTSVTVGLRPVSVAMLAAPERAYVANNQSHSVSVIDADPLSPTYHRVVETIPVGRNPVDVAVWPAGRQVFVLCAGSNTIEVIDGNPGNATFDQVTKSTSCGSGATAVVISSDGSTAYVAMTEGLQIINLATDAVAATVSCGSAATAVVISSDGTLAFVLTSAGQLVVVALSGPNANQVVASASCGSGATAVVISSDGSLAYVSTSDGEVIVFQIGESAGGDASTSLPGPPLRLTRIETFELGGAPAGIAPDPLGRSRVWVANEGTGRLHALGTPDALPRVEVAFRFTPRTINVRSMGRWVKGTIQPPAPFEAESLKVSTIRLNGVVLADADADLGDADNDGVTDLRVKFPRAEVHLLLPAGDEVEVCVEGLIGSRNFIGCDTIRVKHGKVTKPAAGDVVAPGSVAGVRWQSNDIDVEWVSILLSVDHGASWTQVADKEPNDGAFAWNVPLVVADSARIAVVFVEDEDVPEEQADPDYSEDEDVIGIFAMSAEFSIFGATDVRPAPVELAFRLDGPNPSRGTVGMTFGLPRRSDVKLELFDVQGRRVRTLADGVREPGWHSVRWNGDNGHGGRIGAGLYFVRFRAEGREFGERLIWLK